MKRRVLLVGSVILLALGAGAWGLKQWRRGQTDLPTVRVVRGNIDLSIHTTGELRTARSAMIGAPAVAGTLQIVRLAPSGSSVKANDVVVEFDPSEQEFTLEQSRSELEQAEQELVRSKAEADVQDAQDQVELLKARFAVRRAELELGARDVLGAIDVRKKELTLEESQRRLAQLEEDVKSKSTRTTAALAVLEAKRDKARVSMGTARQNIENMTVRTTIDGIVVLKQNMDAGSMYYPGMTLPEYRMGDMVGSGRVIAEILDTSGIELQAKVNEADRANLNVGQAAKVSVDGLAAGAFPGTIKTIAGTAGRGFFLDASRRKFDTTLDLSRADERLRPGLSAEVVISGQQLNGVLYVSRQAVFEKDGKPVVYARSGGGFQPKPVKVKYRSESRAVIEGLTEGTEVALVDPEAPGKAAAAAPASGPAAQGGRR